MRGIKFGIISFVSFFVVAVGTIFVSGSFLNRVFSAIFCTLISINSTFCAVNLLSSSEQVIAANSSKFVSSNADSILKSSSIQSKEVLAQNQPSSSSEASPPVYAFFINGIQNSPNDYSQGLELVQKMMSDAGIKAIFPSNTYNPTTLETFKSFEEKLTDSLLLNINSSLGRGLVQIVTSPIRAIHYLDVLTETPRQYVYQLYRNAWTDSIDNMLGQYVTNNARFTARIIKQINHFDDVAGCIDGKRKERLKPKFIIIAHSQGTMYASQIARSLPPEIAKRTVILAFSPFIRDSNNLNGVHFGHILRADDFAVYAPFRELQPNLEALPVKKVADLETAWMTAKIGAIPNNIPGLVCNKSNECYRLGAPLDSHSLQNYLDPINSKYPEAASAALKLSVDKLKQLANFPVTDYATTNCPSIARSSSHNDPHLVTFDGLKYDLHSIGEVILTKSDDDTFEVQARQEPFGSSMAINSAVAVKVGSDRVALYAKEFPDGNSSTPLRVNGKPVTIQGDKLTLKGGGEILKQGSSYVISSPIGEKVLVSLSSSGNNPFLNIAPFVYTLVDTYSGLLGNVNGNPNDDLQIRGGGNISEIRSTYGDINQVLNFAGLRVPGALNVAEKLYFDQLYKDFGNSWRVKPEESLFDYPTGKTTKNYTDPSFPDKYLTLNMLSTDQIQKARNACTEAKVTQDLMEGCIYDVGFSGYSDFARATAEISGYIGIVNQLFPSLNIPTPEQAVDRVIQQVKPRVCLPFVGCV